MSPTNSLSALIHSFLPPFLLIFLHLSTPRFHISSLSSVYIASLEITSCLLLSINPVYIIPWFIAFIRTTYFLACLDSCLHLFDLLFSFYLPSPVLFIQVKAPCIPHILRDSVIHLRLALPATLPVYLSASLLPYLCYIIVLLPFAVLLNYFPMPSGLYPTFILSY